MAKSKDNAKDAEGGGNRSRKLEINGYPIWLHQSLIDVITDKEEWSLLSTWKQYILDLASRLDEY